MITAKEAYSIAKNYKRAENNLLWTKEIIYKRIEDAAKLGNFDVNVNLRFLPDKGIHFTHLQEVLIADGYEVKTVIDNKYCDFLISWKGDAE